MTLYSNRAEVPRGMFEADGKSENIVVSSLRRDIASHDHLQMSNILTRSPLDWATISHVHFRRGRPKKSPDPFLRFIIWVSFNSKTVLPLT